MAAATNDVNTPERDARSRVVPVAAAEKIFAGSIVVKNATGYAEPGTTALAKVTLGRAKTTVDNSAGADGDVTIEVERGTFRFASDGSITIAEVGTTCYLVDDQTVAKTDGVGTRSAAGTVFDVDALGVWVTI